jgi:hypothetical protein
MTTKSVRISTVKDLILPAPENVYRLRGNVFDAQGRVVNSALLQFYDEQAGVIAQERTAEGKPYLIDLPAGTYSLVASPFDGLGFRQIFRPDSVVVDADRQWNIHLVQDETAIASADEVRPSTFVLWQNFPNPFNPRTVIAYRLPHRTAVRLNVYNIAGQRVETLVREWQAAGRHQVVWDGTDEKGRALSSGIYFYRLQAGAFLQTRRLVLLK